MPACTTRDLRVLDQVGHEAIEHAFERFVEFQLVGRIRILRFRLNVKAFKDAHILSNVCQLQQLGLITIVEIGGV